ncbi:hypothetical protein DdX_10155 [Ditylenchus destructor]|uniref:Uncharacterized protein n=1 Tax=Ditylenchus destructor TaxID=166010 RepID=A0AAD4R5W0_9BILA|nr:hypothetical protein DdX_10155 [Ditylenchus destructor]
MRYGKVYYYDRMGNRLKNQPMSMGQGRMFLVVSIETPGSIILLCCPASFLSALPGKSFLSGKTEDENITNLMFRSPQQGNVRMSAHPSNPATGGSLPTAYHQDYPFKPNYFALESALESEIEFAPDPPSELTDSKEVSGRKSMSKLDNPWDVFMSTKIDEELEPVLRTPKALKPIISPLNSLKSPPEFDDLEQDHLAKELARMDMKSEKALDEQDCNSNIKDFHIRHGVIEHDETGSLCSHCRREELALEETRELENLKKRLASHVDDVNASEAAIHEREREQELAETDGMVLPAFDREQEDDSERALREKQRYKEELEVEIENKRQLADFQEKKQKQQMNALNTLDAEMYAEDQDRQKVNELIDKQKHYDELHEQIEVKEYIKKGEDLRPEWWELKPPPVIDRFAAINEQHDKGRMFEQLRRHEALRDSVEMLEQFKRQQKEQDEEARSVQHKQQHFIKQTLETQASLIAYGTGKRAYAEPTHPDVFRAWEEAHRRNDRRYRVLQDVDPSIVPATTSTTSMAMERARRQAEAERAARKVAERAAVEQYKETVIEKKRCRKCHRPMRERKYTRTVASHYTSSPPLPTFGSQPINHFFIHSNNRSDLFSAQRTFWKTIT